MSQKEEPEFAPARAFYTVEEIRELEKKLVEASPEPGSVMERAGEAAYRWLDDRVIPDPSWPESYFMVCCGSGGNGGDGLALARHLHQNGEDVQVLLPEPVKHEDAKLMYDRAVAAGVTIHEVAEYEKIRKLIKKDHVVVDCLLGIGSSLRAGITLQRCHMCY